MHKKFIVYFLNSVGDRDGMEIIDASSRNEAIAIYKRYFNVHEDLIAIPRIEV